MNARLLAFVVGTAAVAAGALWLTSRGNDGGDVPSGGDAAPVQERTLLNEYRDRGGPAFDHPWTGAEYAAADRALHAMASAEIELPRYQHDVTGPLFARLTSVENFSSRFESMGQMQAAVNSTMKLYMGTRGPDGAYISELIELMAYQVELWAPLLRLAREFLSQIPPTDPSYTTRKQGFDQAVGGVSVMVDGLMITLTETRFYGYRELARLARHLESSLPQLVVLLPEERQVRIRKRLREIAASTDSSLLKSAIDDLARAMDATGATPPPRTR